jgi:hypothetical protein
MLRQSKLRRLWTDPRGFMCVARPRGQRELYRPVRVWIATFDARRDRGERQRRSVGEGQRPRLVSGDALVDQAVLAVAAGSPLAKATSPSPTTPSTEKTCVSNNLPSVATKARTPSLPVSPLPKAAKNPRSTSTLVVGFASRRSFDPGSARASSEAPPPRREG